MDSDDLVETDVLEQLEWAMSYANEEQMLSILAVAYDEIKKLRSLTGGEH